MSDEKLLIRRISKSTPTIALMDAFEKRDENYIRKYDILFLENVCMIKYNKHYYFLSVYIKRKPLTVECIQSTLTFTDFKKQIIENIFSIKERNSFKIINEAFKGCSRIVDFKNIKRADYFFDIPIKFNAQNSFNRCGYGNRYVGENLVHEGTLYGETTDYMFVGVQYQRLS